MLFKKFTSAVKQSYENHWLIIGSEKNILEEISQFLWLCRVSLWKDLRKSVNVNSSFYWNWTEKKKNPPSWGGLLCLLFAYQLSEKMMGHTSFLSSGLSDGLDCSYIIFIWCLLKTNFWKMKINSVDCIWDLIFKIGQFPSSFTYLPEKVPLSFRVWLSRFCWAGGLE